MARRKRMLTCPDQKVGATRRSWPASFLVGPAKSAGIACFNACGTAGGFVGPYLIGERCALAWSSQLGCECWWVLLHGLSPCDSRAARRLPV